MSFHLPIQVERMTKERWINVDVEKPHNLKPSVGQKDNSMVWLYFPYFFFNLILFWCILFMGMVVFVMFQNFDSNSDMERDQGTKMPIKEDLPVEP